MKINRKVFVYEQFKREVNGLKKKVDEYKTSSTNCSVDKIRSLRGLIEKYEQNVDTIMEFIPYLEKHFEEKGYKSYVKDGVEYQDGRINFEPQEVLQILHQRLNGIQTQVKQKEVQIVNTRKSIDGMKKEGFKSGEYHNWYCLDEQNSPFKISLHINSDFEWKDKFMNGYKNLINELKEFIQDKQDKLVEVN